MPPSGPVRVIAPQDDDAGLKDYGQETALVLDDKGSPMIAFSSGNETGELFFMKWDACAGAFTTPAVVDAVGVPGTWYVNENNPLRQVSIARDPSSGALAIAYTKAFPAGANPGNAGWLAKSTDGGKTWQKEQLSVHPTDQAGDIHGVENPIVTFAGGKLYVAYYQDYVHCDGTFSGSAPRCDGWFLDGDLGSWSRQVIPRGSNGSLAGKPMGLAADSAGKIALAYITSPDTGYNRIVEFWRPGSNPIDVFDSNNVQNDDPSLSLAFFGNKPRIAAHLIRDTGSTDYQMLFAQSDDGTTWSAPVKIPQDGAVGTSTYQSLAIDSKGDVAIAARASTSSDPGGQCGWPKIARSTDGKSWTTCGATLPMPDGTFGGLYVSAAYGPDDKLQLAFYNDSGDQVLGAGVLYWHE